MKVALSSTLHPPVSIKISNSAIAKPAYQFTTSVPFPFLGLCLSADAAHQPGNDIPLDATTPSGTVCGSKVTIDLDALLWTSESGTVTGSCTSTGVTSVCNPPFAECHYTDVVVCESSICDA